MSGKIDICNLALAQLGENPVASLTEQSENARRLDLMYEPERKAVLRAHEWGFAQRWDNLAALDLPPEEIPAGFGCKAWAYPAKALMVTRVFPDGCHRPGRDWQWKEFYSASQGVRALAVNKESEKLRVCYTADVQDTTLFDDLFVKAFALDLAHALAQTITGKEDLGSLCLQKYQLLIDEARIANMSERRDVPEQTSAFIEVR